MLRFDFPLCGLARVASNPCSVEETLAIDDMCGQSRGDLNRPMSGTNEASVAQQRFRCVGMHHQEWFLRGWLGSVRTEQRNREQRVPLRLRPRGKHATATGFQGSE